MSTATKTLRVLLVALTATAATWMPVAATAETTTSTTTTKYGLAPSIQEGVMLHCFDWTYKQIMSELVNIAEAGFTTVQTSPAQEPCSSDSWYWLYQPLGFYLPDEGPLGTPEELTALCDSAHALGMFIIVDVVANHLAGDHTNIQSDLTDSKYWHAYGSLSDSDYASRYAVTHGDIGMTDLATENTYVQSCVLSYLKDLIACGVDGFRWDAAKHIDLPEEGWDCDFWPAMTTEADLTTGLGNEPYHYGEILNAPATDDWTQFPNYAKYIAFTDDEYGNNILSSLNSGSAYSSYCRLTSSDDIDDEDVVYWAESHDTYSNDNQATTFVGTNIIDRTWAIVGSRNGIPALYFSRPFETTNDDITIGEKGSTHFTATEVAAVNHFHNATNGNADYFVYDKSNNVNAICRANGAVIVLGSGSNKAVSVTNGGSYTATGTYTDEISGNTFTVTSSTISGTVGSTGIAVFYNDTRPTITFDPEEGSFTTETLTVTATMSNATSGTITVGGTTYTLSSSQNTASFTIGSDMDYGESITISWTAVGSSSTVAGTETYTKKDPDDVIYVYYNNPNSWSTVYCYIYDDSGNEVASWPGEAMTYNSSLTLTAYPSQTGWWVYEVPDGFEYGYVIFTNSTGSSQYPTSDGLELDGESMICYGTTWSDTEGTVTDDNGVTIYVWPTSDSTPAPHLYVWTTSGSTTTELNGSFNNAKQMSTQKTLGAKTFYYQTFEDYDEINCIFWNSADELPLTSTSGIDIYVTCSVQPYIYWWYGSNDNDSPQAMTATSIDGLYYYSISSSYSTVNIILTPAANWSDVQTSDITGLTSDTWLTYDGASSYSYSSASYIQSDNIEGLTAGTYFSYTTPTDYIQCGELEEGIYPATTAPYFCYLVNTKDWTYPYAWIWNEIENTNNYTGGTWPGEKLTNVVDSYTYKGVDYDVYKWVTSSSLPEYVIFSSGSSGAAQTNSLVFVNGGYYDGKGNLLGIDKAIFDQYTANGNYDENNITVHLVHTLSSAYWNSFCSPINLSAADITTYFGDGCQVEYFSKQTDSSFYTSPTTAITAGTPYLVLPASTVTNPDFEGVSINNTAAGQIDFETGYYVTGTYDPVDLDLETNLFLTTGGELYFPIASDYTMYGLRTYFTIPESNDDATPNILFGTDDTWTDGIEEITATHDADNQHGAVYSISGQQLNNNIDALPKGIYIRNGRKFIVK